METLKNKDLYKIYQGIIAVNDAKGKCEGNISKFRYAISKNKAKIESEIKHLESDLSKDEKFFEFMKTKDALLQKYATKDENGQFVKIPSGPNAFEYDIAEDKKEEMQKELDTFIADSKEILDERDAKIKRHAEILEEDSTVNLHLINIEDIPDDVYQDKMDLIIQLVKDEVITNK